MEIRFLARIIYSLLPLIFITLVHTDADEVTINEEVSMGLYDYHDDVAIISGKAEYANVVYNKSTAWIVLFYVHWCGHCIRFSPTYKQFASEAEAWKPFLGVGVVDCAVDVNTRLCGSKSITGYPTIEFQPPFSTADTVSPKLSNFKAFLDLRNATVSFISSIADSSPKYRVLQPIPSLHKLNNQRTANTNYTFLVVTDRNSPYIGLEVKLDLLPEKDILVHYTDISNVPVDILSSIKNVNAKPPLLLYIDDTGNLELIVQNASQALDIEVAIGNITDRNLLPQALVEPTQEIIILSGTKQRAKSVNLIDLESGLTYILTREVPLMTLISDEKLAALKAFVTVLDKYFPARPELKNFLDRLCSWLNTINDTGIKGHEWADKIQSLQIDMKLPAITWVGCAGSSPRYRGYTCSLWKIFHTLTVQARNYHFINEVADYSPYELLNTIRNYIKYFFECEDCRNNFLKGSLNLKQEIKKPNDAVMWFWRMHNSVNKRLRGDVTEDSMFPKLPFPYVEYCKECQIEDLSGNREFDVGKTMVFLSLLYDQKCMVANRTDDYPYDGLPGDMDDYDWMEAVEYHEND